MKVKESYDKPDNKILKLDLPRSTQLIPSLFG